ncbi:TraR/DksA C4-type zinc finger protein [Sporosarcina highlanderae]|uniref:TraR/DksA C4-type zinc finger protein n=1 Tax=Sporosarcina highlanderae TaxID=3035916 RepID=A0ABT8JRL0_9BACL|nr:TraR/DksA C4-type zinc finger protein [Sporosarcina highlanderae]MDN4607796.1 TraR/DksA C4-type zinc finger protein [Sporosarcina highlanderae]
MLSDQQKNVIKQELFELKSQFSKTERETDIRNSERDAVGELSTYDNHPGDLGTELFERQKDMALNVHAGDEISKVENALQALSDGTYGYCQVCEREIPFERLEALPYTTYCIEHSPDQDIPEDRPSEKDILIMANPNTFSDRRDGIYRDGQDSFQEIAKSGTSETPSDFIGDHDDYNTLYADEILDGAAEEVEEFISTDITGETRGFVRSEISEEYEGRLDDEGIESPLGDIPYHRKDSYTGEK